MIHLKNVQKSMLEICKSMNYLNPSYIWHLHERKEIQYDIRTMQLCKLLITMTIKFGMESLSFRVSLLRNNLNDEIKELPTAASFKTKIKTWKSEQCNCRIIDVGTGGGTGGMCPQDFAIKKGVPCSFSENVPFFLRKEVPSMCRAPKFEMLLTSPCRISNYPSHYVM